MIALENICKTYETRSGEFQVLKDINLRVEKGQKLAIVGGNGSGKSTLIKIAGGAEYPTSGRILRDMKVSWPLAFAGAFQSGLTGMDNLRFICRVYEREWREALDFVEDFSQLGSFLKEPIRTYSSGMRARLAFAVSMCIEFDCYLLDEVYGVGDARFQQRCHEELFVKRADRAFLIVSHDARFLRDHCNSGAMIHRGVLTHYSSIDEAQDAHEEIMRRPH